MARRHCCLWATWCLHNTRIRQSSKQI